MPRIVIEPAYYTGVPVQTFHQDTPEDVSTHATFDAAIAYWQCEYGYSNPRLLDRTSGRYVVVFESPRKSRDV